jgi:hypothetical protein
VICLLNHSQGCNPPEVITLASLCNAANTYYPNKSVTLKLSPSHNEFPWSIVIWGRGRYSAIPLIIFSVNRILTNILFLILDRGICVFLFSCFSFVVVFVVLD